MLPSEQLRQSISIKYNINLEQFAWSNEIRERIFSIKTDTILETSSDTLEDIFKEGFNIGHCGLTSRYIAITFPQATLYYGTAKLLVGTKNSDNGEHAWNIIDNYLIDSTLMIAIPIHLITELGYIAERQIAHDSARILSEYDLFQHEYNAQNNISLTHKKTNL